MNTGAYNRPFVWLKRTVTKNTSTGQEEETFGNNGTLWGSIKELSASKRLAYGMQNSQADMEIHLRQWPSIDSKDRLRETKFNQLLVIDGITHDEQDTIIYAHRLTEIT